jgi:hypothetical protein
MSGVCLPEPGTEAWTHHWIGLKGGDMEPWLWTGEDWVRGGERYTPEGQAARGWQYQAPCIEPAVVEQWRRRLAAAEAGRGAVVPFPAPATP